MQLISSIVELNDISFSYNEEVLTNISLTISKGEYIGIIGPNGGGKSTLLRVMLGLLTPQKGAAKLFGQDVTTFKDWYKVGYVPQKTHIDINFPATVEEVVKMGTYARRGLFHFSTKEDQGKVNKALQQVEMIAFKHRLISDLSVGQQQRVFIARALVTDPEIIFLDEPTVGIDIKTQKQFYTLLQKLNKELHLTLVLVSHELDVVIHEASAVGYINRTLDYYGNPQEILHSECIHELIGKGGVHHV